MNAQRHIAVLFHENSLERDFQYTVVFHMARFWREAGHRVTFLCGTRRFVPADVLFVHVDLSVVPDRYLDFASRYPAAVNGRARDIRKSTVSSNLVRPGTDWQGPVIVKTDCNYGGQPEESLRSGRTARWTRALFRRLASRALPPPPRPAWTGYRIFERIDDVPLQLAGDPRLVIERFLPEVEDGLYHVRLYQFLGDRVSCRRQASPEPLVKASTVVRSEPVEPEPIVEEWRRRFGLDYGKLDYAVHRGTPVLFDANKTTGTDPHMTAEVERRRRHHAAGIESFFPA